MVLLDGLDELLQASEHDRSSYLEDVMDFQEREANQRRPVVVIVTSRTVVADRVRIPDGTTLVKLDPFNDDDIAGLDRPRWQRVNAAAIAAGTIGELTLSAVRRQPELAEQPLLLRCSRCTPLTGLPPLDEDMATAELYRRLLEGSRGERQPRISGSGTIPSPDELEQRVQDHLERLAVAALGMFNRGRQDISEDELMRDLEILVPPHQRSDPGRRGRQRIIGGVLLRPTRPKPRTLQPVSQTPRRQPQRAYEFLHATFGEYLVARRVMDELLAIARNGVHWPTRARRVARRHAVRVAVASGARLAARRSMLDFASEIFG